MLGHLGEEAAPEVVRFYGAIEAANIALGKRKDHPAPSLPQETILSDIELLGKLADLARDLSKRLKRFAGHLA